MFVRLVAELIREAGRLGYELTFGETYRTPEQAALNARKGIGIANSLHTSRLAIDFNLFLEGRYLSSTDSFRPLGEFWESMSTDDYTCRWGGRFRDAKTGKPKPDGGHFSIEHGGRA